MAIRVYKPTSSARRFMSVLTYEEITKKTPEKSLIEYLKEHADDRRPLRLINYLGVSPKVPVYIIYYTVYPNPENGKMEFWPDLYGYDKAIANEMGAFLLKR